MPSEQNSGEPKTKTAGAAASVDDAQNLPETLDSSNPEQLNEDSALALLKQPDLSPEVLEKISKTSVTKNRKVKLALAGHPKTPRHVSLPLVRHLFTFDLMQVALIPTVPADVKKAAEDSLMHRLETISSGERLTLARRASGRVAGELLLDKESRVMQAALENSRLTEISIVKAVLKPAAVAAFVHAVCHHPKWSLRREIRIALLRSKHTPMAKAVEFAQGIPVPMLKEILQNSGLPDNTKSDLLKDFPDYKSAAQK
ncbi:MAG TPA: hypothetical protein VGF44_17215 [Terriglobales bacterium]|jgi:hypothetical protein